LVSAYCGNVTRGDFIERFSRINNTRSAQPENGTGCSHMRRETVQVQHVSPDAVDAKEWRKVTERLKRNNGVQLRIGQFLMRKYLREVRDRQAPGQNIHSQTLPEAGFNGGEQTQDCKGIAAGLEKIRAHIDNWPLQYILPDRCKFSLEFTTWRMRIL
jgi:hypothetical protein